ncbi:MAG: PEGA domain-containing protein [Planctomycetes bacterium]|nr:PEGA domain-containing protein [Planctomycetota bacterium]
MRAPLERLRPAPRLPLAFAVAALASCQAERALRITSEPSQAEVRLDGSKVGTTPCEVPFEHYGVRRLTLYLPGYATYSRVMEIEPPWYGQFPIDIFTEVLIPIGWSDIQKVHVRLAQGQSVLLEPDLPGVIERADLLRHAGPTGPRKRAEGDKDEQP